MSEQESTMDREREIREIVDEWRQTLSYPTAPTEERREDLIKSLDDYCATREEAAVEQEHENHVQFASDIYCTLVDPVDDETKMSEAQLFVACLSAAVEQREQCRKYHDGITKAAAAERERCAKICDDYLEIDISQREYENGDGPRILAQGLQTKIRTVPATITPGTVEDRQIKANAREWDCETADRLAGMVREDRLRAALERMVESTEQWNEAVEKIIGRQPGTGIDLAHARVVLEDTK